MPAGSSGPMTAADGAIECLFSLASLVYKGRLFRLCAARVPAIAQTRARRQALEWAIDFRDREPAVSDRGGRRDALGLGRQAGGKSETTDG
jgi:hypothetical protein